MTPEDFEYVQKVFKAGFIRSPCLELGTAYEGPTVGDYLRAKGIEYASTDIKGDVDYVVDFESDLKDVLSKQFGTVLVLNVLEHVFDPIALLDNALSILRPGGTCVVIAPSVWPLHYFPLDCWRINPDFYLEYARRREVVLVDELFEYIGRGKVTESLPPAATGFKLLRSRVVHKLFNTSARLMLFPSHVATGAVFRKK